MCKFKVIFGLFLYQTVILKYFVCLYHLSSETLFRSKTSPGPNDNLYAFQSVGLWILQNRHITPSDRHMKASI